MRTQTALYNEKEVIVDNRVNLGKIFQDNNQLGIGAEIGVLYGTYTNQLFENWEGQVLAVDIWTERPQYLRAIEALGDTNTLIVKGASMDVVKLIKDESLDWIYIDGDHSYQGARDDIYGWAPKVRKGGIISGHDYIQWNLMTKQEKETHPYLETNHVYKAVDEFCAEFGYKIDLFHDNVMLIDGQLRHFPDLASWWFKKHE